MKTETRHLIAGIAITIMLVLAWEANAAAGPDPTSSPEGTVTLKHGTVTLCGMLVMYVVDQEGEWFNAYLGQPLRQLAPQIRKFQGSGQLEANAELADYYPPVYWSCERIHEAQIQWGRSNSIPEEDITEMEKAFKNWRDTYRPPSMQ